MSNVVKVLIATAKTIIIYLGSLLLLSCINCVINNSCILVKMKTGWVNEKCKLWHVKSSPKN